MQKTTSTLITLAGVKVGTNFEPGQLVQLLDDSQTASNRKPQLALVVGDNEFDCGLLALTSCPAIELARGELRADANPSGIALPDLQLTAEIPFGSAPAFIDLPARSGKGLYLGVSNQGVCISVPNYRMQQHDRHWLHFEITTGRRIRPIVRTAFFDTWTLVASTADDRRIEIPMAPSEDDAPTGPI